LLQNLTNSSTFHASRVLSRHAVSKLPRRERTGLRIAQKAIVLDSFLRLPHGEGIDEFYPYDANWARGILLTRSRVVTILWCKSHDFDIPLMVEQKSMAPLDQIIPRGSAYSIPAGEASPHRRRRIS
jgi:hypothetical protein